MSSTPLLQVRDVARYFGNVHAVDGVSFDLDGGHVMGVIGANGAGKTTLMRILATLDLPDRGEVFMDGVDIADYPNAVRPRIGWMPDHFAPYKNMTVADYLDFFGRAQGLPASDLPQRVQESAAFVDLVPLALRSIDRLSKGELQRLCLARTLIKDPQLLILDEPAAGLDPKARLEFKNLVRLLRERGKTVVVSSHILTELAEMCDSLLFINHGKVVHHGDMETLRRGTARAGALTILIRVRGDTAPLLNWLTFRAGWKLLEQLRDGARGEFTGDLDGLPAELRSLSAENILVADFHRVERKLEEAFVEILRGAGERSWTATETPPR